jgi:hypothetical protein
MGFLDIFGRKNNNSLDLSLLPYAREFDPTLHKEKLLKIKQYEDACIPFKVRQQRNKGRWVITEFDHFPLEEEVQAAVYDEYGGANMTYSLARRC